MLSLVFLQLGAAVLIFLVTLASVLLPLRLAARCAPTPARGRLLSLANCMSAGVFLGTCNLQLRPTLERHVRRLLEAQWGDGSQSTRVMEVSILLGVLVVMLTEHAVHALQAGAGPGAGHAAAKGVSDVNQNGEAVKLMESDDSDSVEETSLTGGADMTRTHGNQPIPHEGHSHSGADGHFHSGAEGHSQSGAEGHSHAGAEGHSHVADMLRLSETDSGVRCALLVTAMGVHSLLEGVALGLQDSAPHLLSLAIGILTHEVFVMVAVGFSMAGQRTALTTLVKVATALCAMIPVGVGVGMALGVGRGKLVGSVIALGVNGLATGTFVYIVFVEILPPEFSRPTDRLLKIACFVVGVGLMGGLAVALD